MRARWLGVLHFGVMSSIGYCAPLKASEVVAVNCPQGVLVVADKRITFSGLKRGQADNGSKVMLASPYLIATTGRKFIYQADEVAPGQVKISEQLDTLTLCAQTVKHIPYPSLLSPDTCNYLHTQLTPVLQRQLNLQRLPSGLAGKSVVAMLAFKPNTKSRTVEGLFMDFRYGKAHSGIYDLDISIATFLYKPNLTAFRVIGDNRLSWSDVSKLRPSCNSMQAALEWAEHEIFQNHQVVVRNGQHTIGNVVDEYLVGYDGRLSILKTGKTLRESPEMWSPKQK